MGGRSVLFLQVDQDKDSRVSLVMRAGAFLVALSVGLAVACAEVTEGPWLINGSPVDKEGLRITTLGSGTPDVRKDQVSSGFLLELGNGDKFIWDLGTGSYQNLLATATPLKDLTKVRNCICCCHICDVHAMPT